MTRNDVSVTIGVALVLASVVAASSERPAAPAARQAAQAVQSTPERMAEMRHHFTQVMTVHEAVIRGDLAAVREPAERLAGIAVPAGLPPVAAPFVANLRQAARRAAEAKTLAAAAAATVTMVGECANCHQAVGVYPVPSVPATHDLGGIVGHMLEHQRAADEMLQGLLIPSPAQWRRGAERLEVAALHPSELPRDRQWTMEIRGAEARVHQVAAKAVKAGSPSARAATYVELLSSCATCHSLHKRIWGPGRVQ